jgi:hypothetical protein
MSNLAAGGLSTATRNPQKDGASSTVTEKSPGGDDLTSMVFSPSAGTDLTSQLHQLKDESSALSVVAKTCLQLTQFAGSGSSAHVEDSTSVMSSVLFHEASFVDAVRLALAALMTCTIEHTNRRCRILAAKTLAILARSAYARIRPSPLLFATRDARITGLEDEVGAEVPTTLITAVLEDADDGVSASAMEAIEILISCNSPTSGTLVEDELMREIQAIGWARPSSYSPSLRNIVDEDPSIPQMELATRVLDNIMIPRLGQIVDRISLYKSSVLLTQVLPVLTMSLVHFVKTTPGLLATMDRPTFAKRWTEVDALGIVDSVLTGIILPMVESNSLQGTIAACHAALRLAHVCSGQPWVQDVCQAATHTLMQELIVPCDVEQRLSCLAMLLVAARGISLTKRTSRLIWAANTMVETLPSTTRAPMGVLCPGVLVEVDGEQFYRRPARMGLWTELALSFFIDGPTEEERERFEAIQIFFSSGTIGTIIAEKSRLTVLPLFDELLLAFTSVAVECGRRFRVANGTPLSVDVNATEVRCWLKICWVVLTTFVSCVTVGRHAVYLEEDLSLLTAGQTMYVRLVQSYAHFLGLISLESSVSFKLAANACPPHLLWDQLSDSSSFMSRCGVADSSDVENVNKLMDEIVIRETTQNLASYHMRMFLLSLAADTWVAGRALSIRQHLETGNPLSLTVNSAREIVMALGPKRLIAKIYEGHVLPVDAEGRKKKDPVKTLAKEAVRASVAAIENIALVACSWRRRFGQNQEAKHLVSVSVGILQGRVDETPVDDTMKSIMMPICDAAVARIQAEYENEGMVPPTASFPISDFIMQPIKPKIKPLVSNSKPVVPDKEKFLRSHLMQLCRQIVSSRIDQCALSLSSVNGTLSPSRRCNWLRLVIPPQLESNDGRPLGIFCTPSAVWSHATIQSSAASDAAALVVAYSPRRYFRHDGEEEYRVTFLARVFNTTPVDISGGIKLELGISRFPHSPTDVNSSWTTDIIASLGEVKDAFAQHLVISSASVYRQEIRSGEQLSWEVSLDPRFLALNASLRPSVVYRNVSTEPDAAGSKWAGEGPLNRGDASTSGGESKSGEEDFQVKPKGKAANEPKETENVVLSGEPISLSPLSGLQPCPLVFFCNCWGDLPTFRLFWFSMPFRLAPIKIAASENPVPSHPSDKRLALISSLRWDGEAIPGGFASGMWALMALNGSRVLCCLVEIDDGKKAPGLAVHFRGDNKRMLYSLTASKAARESIVSALCPGYAPLE